MMKQEKQAGFTLVELMTVIVIIALLAALILGLAGNAQKTAARKRAEAEISQLENFLKDYQMKYGRVPNADTLKDELKKANHSLSNLLDPWGEEYVYTDTSRATYYLYSTAGAVSNSAGYIGRTPMGK